MLKFCSIAFATLPFIVSFLVVKPLVKWRGYEFIVFCVNLKSLPCFLHILSCFEVLLSLNITSLHGIVHRLTWKIKRKLFYGFRLSYGVTVVLMGVKIFYKVKQIQQQKHATENWIQIRWVSFRWIFASDLLTA